MTIYTLINITNILQNSYKMTYDYAINASNLQNVHLAFHWTQLALKCQIYQRNSIKPPSKYDELPFSFFEVVVLSSVTVWSFRTNTSEKIFLST